MTPAITQTYVLPGGATAHRTEIPAPPPEPIEVPAAAQVPEGPRPRRRINQTPNHKPRVDWHNDLYLQVIKVWLHAVNFQRYGPDEDRIARERLFVKPKELAAITFAKFPDLPAYYQLQRRDDVLLTPERLFDRLYNMYYQRDPNLPSPHVVSTEHVTRNSKLAAIAERARALFAFMGESPIRDTDVEAWFALQAEGEGRAV
jgi:hypothetical protein